MLRKRRITWVILVQNELDKEDRLREVMRKKSDEIRQKHRSRHSASCVSSNVDVFENFDLEDYADQITSSFDENVRDKPRSFLVALRNILEDADRNSKIGKVKLDYFEDSENPENSAYKIEMSYIGDGRRMELWDKYSNYATTCFEGAGDSDRDHIFIRLV